MVMVVGVMMALVAMAVGFMIMLMAVLVLAMVIGDDAHQPILAVGGHIGTLTLDQARRLVRIANSARLTFSDDGSPRLIVAA